MSEVHKQWQTTMKRNGTFVDNFKVGSKSLPVPMTTNFDVYTIGAYWFTRMRQFLAAGEPEFFTWSAYRRDPNGDWQKEDIQDSGSLGEITLPDASVYIVKAIVGLDVYLALPTRSMVDNDSSDPSDRFMQGFEKDIKGATATRIIVNSSAKPSFGYLVNFKSLKASTADASVRGTYKNYLRNLMSRWESLIRSVVKTKSYVLPKPLSPGENFAALNEAKAFWQLIADIESYMGANQEILDSQITWSVWAENAGAATKKAAEQIISEGSTLAGDAAAWAADQAGRAYGNFYGSFLENVGLWGLAFVAVLVYLY